MTKVMEINKLVFAFMRLSEKQNSVMKDILLRDLNRVYLTGEISGYDTVLEFCHMLGIIDYDGNHIMLTDEGVRYSQLCSFDDGVANLDPNPQQKNALLAMMLRSDKIMSRIMPFVDELCIDFASVPKSWFARFTHCSKDMLDFMRDIGFLNNNENILRISQDMSSVVSVIKNEERKTMSEEELLSILQINKDTGKTAENMTMKFERERLEKEGLFDMALAIQQISTVDVAAGFDILSFDGKSSSYVHDRRIEVKGTISNEDFFFWSEGEIKAAKKFGNTYWIYFWKNIGKKNSLPIMINDPYDKFWAQAKTKPRPVAFRVKCGVTEDVKT